MQTFFKRIEQKYPRFANILQSALGSLIVVPIVSYLPEFSSWLKESSWKTMINFVDKRFIKAATLQSTNYSFFIISVVFVIAAIMWISASEKILTTIKNKKIDKKKNDNPGPIIKTIIIGTVIYVSCFFVYILIQISGEVITLNAITDFNQHTRIIKPYISQQEYDKLISEWSQMRSYNDYKKLHGKIIEISQQNKLKLYKNHTY